MQGLRSFKNPAKKYEHFLWLIHGLLGAMYLTAGIMIKRGT